MKIRRSMKIRSLFKITLLCFFTIVTSCSSDDDNPTLDDRSFTTDATTDFFINSDGTVNITVTGEFTDSGIAGNVTSRGFVYGTTSNPEVSNSNTVSASGANPVHATFDGLDAGQTIFIRGFFEMSDGTYFYGNEIQTTTNVDASDTRSITIVMKPELVLENFEGISPELEVTALEKEAPIEIGFEYSINNDFSNSSIALADVTGNVFITTYDKFIEGLMSSTVYYFRPYAKYADGTITNGGNSTESFTTQ
ncbi:hypothetical protein BFR04_01520 [Gaetbulibacter sp. 4G1]|nr:hypothetical protein [Gaetbulibacter sp. 4G1]PIA79549.1 hypothetical protein BFR04_01520 [Gaetbulibacter sp. 4G1]